MEDVARATAAVPWGEDEVHAGLPPCLVARELTGPSRLVVLVDPATPLGERTVAVAAVAPGDGGTAELALVAVDRGLPPEEPAARLVAAAADLLRADGARRLVATGAVDPVPGAGTLRRLGFRPAEREPGWYVLEL